MWHFLTILETPALQRLKVDHYVSQDSAGIVAAFLCRLDIKLSTLVIQDGPAAIVTEILR